MSDLPPPPPTPPSATPPAYPPPAYQPPAYQPPTYQPPPAGSPGYIPPPIAPMAAGAGISLVQQFFSGAALGSIICGLLSIVVPFATSFYFPILPIIGLINGFAAIRRGRLIGGIVGIVLNILGGIVSLIASGLINPGG